MMRLIINAHDHQARTAIIDHSGRHRYKELLDASFKIALQLLKGRSDLQEARIAFMVRPSFEYVATQWGIWRAGGIAVPICVSYPAPSIEYLLDDTQAEQVIADGEFQRLLAPLCKYRGISLLPAAKTFLELDPAPIAQLPDIELNRRAMIIYTSGTTGKPKGVVTRHSALETQIRMLVEAWKWEKEDHILNILPLHHVHGVVNMLSCALWSGACCEFLPAFDAEKVYERFEKGEINLFMAVPTIYYKLIAHFEGMPPNRQQKVSHKLGDFRLMVSGSAALPVSTLERWKEISGHTLLERYGMTEMGMAISNPYEGERRPGCIGQPLPGVSIRLVNDEGKVVPLGESGEIQVKGANVFQEYWRKPEATQKAFTKEAWFQTGDIAVIEKGYYRILGRNSVDIIKSGGYKISALEIEEILRKYPGITDCAVVGVPDEEWGERVVAGLVIDNSEIDKENLTSWLKEQLPGYKIPRSYRVLKDLPRNTMGKVTKIRLKKMFGNPTQ